MRVTPMLVRAAEAMMRDALEPALAIGVEGGKECTANQARPRNAPSSTHMT